MLDYEQWFCDAVQKTPHQQTVSFRHYSNGGPLVCGLQGQMVSSLAMPITYLQRDCCSHRFPIWIN